MLETSLDFPFLENATLEEVCDIAKDCGYPLTNDQCAVAQIMVNFEYGFGGLSDPGGCGK